MSKRPLSPERPLLALRHGSFASSRAIEDLLATIREHGLPDSISRRTHFRQRASAINDLQTPYGPILRDVTLGSHVIPVEAPLPMLFTTCQVSAPFRDRMLEMLRRHPCSPDRPWSIVLYSDEISPQNPLAAGVDQRKVQAIYWTLREIGHDVSYAEELWFTLAIIRSTVVQSLAGGMSTVLYNLLPLFFGDSGHDIRTSGILLNLCGTRTFLHCQIAVHISDEPALAAVLGAKGHAGNKPCPCCRNITSRAWANSDLNLEPITSIDLSKWVPHTDETVRAVFRRLASVAATGTKAQLEELETMLGWKHCPSNVVCFGAGEFRPISTLMFDWMHIFVAHGLLDREFELFAAAVQKQHPRFGLLRQLNDYVQKWTLPRQFASISTVFSKGKLSATASQQLSLVPVLAKFCRDVLHGHIEPKALDSMLALCRLVELVREVSQHNCNADTLHDATMEYAKSHQSAHGSAHWVFKHHQALHLPGMLRKHGG